MDLSYLFSRHQLSLVRAGSAASSDARARRGLASYNFVPSAAQ